MNKKQELEYLNQKVLFQSRKNFGMLGNIQWSVRDIISKTLYVEVSSSTIDGGHFRSRRTVKAQISKNIKESIRNNVPDMKVHIHWKKWKKEDGFGFLVSTYGKTQEDIANEIFKKINFFNEGWIKKMVKIQNYNFQGPFSVIASFNAMAGV